MISTDDGLFVFTLLFIGFKDGCWNQCKFFSRLDFQDAFHALRFEDWSRDQSWAKSNTVTRPSHWQARESLRRGRRRPSRRGDQGRPAAGGSSSHRRGSGRGGKPNGAGPAGSRASDSWSQVRSRRGAARAGPPVLPRVRVLARRAGRANQHSDISSWICSEPVGVTIDRVAAPDWPSVVL